jgi:hypothetical protein
MINQKNIFISLSFLIYVSYFFGFFLNENSIGSGGYNSDVTWIWKNFEIFQNKNLLDAIKDENFFGNRTPLMYILNIYLNPFVDNYESYRFSIFIFSLIGPITFYKCLKVKFKNSNKEILFLISSIILLSPFYRTTAYWGMEINYAIITMLISCYYFLILSFEKENKNFKNIFLLIFFSSITLYFDQKFLFLPMLIFLKIVISKLSSKFKIYTILLYSFLALPYIYLIDFWGGVVPIKTQEANPNTITTLNRVSNFYFYNLGYASTIIGFYLFPLLFFRENNLFKMIKDFFKNKNYYLIFLIPFIYIICLYNTVDYNFYTKEEYWVGLGIVHKLAIILFDNLKLQEVFTYIMFVLSWLVIFLFIELKTRDLLILSFFFILQLFIWPMMQEYFDLVITISAFLLFRTKIKPTNKNSLFLILYSSVFLITANIYYFKIL